MFMNKEPQKCKKRLSRSINLTKFFVENLKFQPRDHINLGPFNEAPICLDDLCNSDIRPKVHRGGSFSSLIDAVTSTARSSAPITHQYFGIIGFRVVKAIN
jgi:hypothetical protein